jgi:hypothetical protein
MRSETIEKTLADRGKNRDPQRWEGMAPLTVPRPETFLEPASLEQPCLPLFRCLPLPHLASADCLPFRDGVPAPCSRRFLVFPLPSTGRLFPAARLRVIDACVKRAEHHPLNRGEPCPSLAPAAPGSRRSRLSPRPGRSCVPACQLGRHLAGCLSSLNSLIFSRYCVLSRGAACQPATCLGRSPL